MGKQITSTIVGTIFLIGVFLVFMNYNQLIAMFSNNSGFDPSNVTYTIEGQSITLVDGVAEILVAPDSSAKLVTKVFGSPTMRDLNGDGKTDAVVTLTQNAGGSGTFYYVAAAINTESGAQGTNAIFLGDRISPQSIQILGSQIVVNYLDRDSGEAMTVKPSVGVSKYVVLDGLTLSEVQ